GGAISIEADGNGTVTISSGGRISANGGGVAKSTYNGGGGGSGGSIRIAGKSIHNSGSIQAKGGIPPTTSSTYSGGIGGGGRVSFSTSANLYEGNVDVGSGVYQGTIGYNTPPTISSALTASVAYSNTNYQKRSTTRYNNLVIWYPFDEADGTVAIDYSSNERNATLKNMSAVNRIAGKLGGAISFDTPSSKLSSDSTGQYLDLGSWSFGGAFTLSTWIKHDQWRSHGTIFNLPGSDSLQLRYNSTSSNNLYLLLNGTSGGNESIDSGADLLDWEKWYHLAISLENGGTNNSTARIYKDGSLFSTVTGLSVPDVVSRSNQYIARSNTGTDHYFVGELDDFRLYGTALSATDISAIFTERSAGVHYQATALNNPTGFSATGLPSGLTINPTNGEITGHSTSVGDHNITLFAHNLSGTSPGKNITLTINAEKPLLESIPPVVAKSDIIAWWEFDETSGTSSFDSSGNGNYATLVNMDNADWVSGKYGNALELDGSNDYITTQLKGHYNMDFSWSIWMKSSDANAGLMAVSGASWTLGGYCIYISGGAPKIDVGWVGSNVGSGLVNNNSWNHVALTVQDSGGTSDAYKIYVNGVLNKQGNLNWFAYDGTNIGVRFGSIANSDGGYFAGKLDDIRVYSKLLSANEISLIYQGDMNPIEVSSIGSNSATVTATLLESGGANTTLDIFYGTSDRGETPTGWDSTSSLTANQNAGAYEFGLSGLSANTSYFYRVRASNAAGSIWSEATSFTTGTQAQAPSIAALDASSVTGTTTTANGNLLSFDGSDQPTVTLQYVEKSVGWESIVNTANLGTKAVGTFTHNLTGLTAGTAYEYLFSATNNGGTAYSGIKSFTTLGPPAVETTAASEITKTSAKLNANLTFANGSDTSVTFYWNTSDGGNTPSTWTAGSGGTHSLSGTHGISTLSHTLSGLTTGTTYYYTVKAVNPQGTVWGTTKTFVPANTALNQYSIPDLALWLDASDINGDNLPDSVTSAIAVSSWTDKSTSGIGVSQSNPDLQPSQLSNQFGSKPAVRFDGTGDVLNLGSIRTSSGGYSAYALVK
ncbi:MAG: hypothetical protein EBY48_06465, partial [Opitutae bacterium]|nr:hypothetical protein [Opitutae bacterium]